ncbi:MAG TPA: transglutaminase N-terminal domain-containing protein, partial [Acidimicrobiia bacterium]
MSWMLRIEHRSAYRYGEEVLSSYNEARMTPLTTDRQTAVESRVEVEPRSRSFRYLDYWASVVDVFDIHVPHTALTITATSVVETTEAPPQPSDPGWDLLSSEPVLDRFAEFLAPTA